MDEMKWIEAYANTKREGVPLMGAELPDDTRDIKIAVVELTEGLKVTAIIISTQEITERRMQIWTNHELARDDVAAVHRIEPVMDRGLPRYKIADQHETVTQITISMDDFMASLYGGH